MQHIFEHIHVSLGAEYWVSITLMAGLLRLCMFPLQARASDNSAKMASIASVTKPLQERAKVAREKQDQAEGKRANGTLGVVYKQAGVNLWTNLLPMLQLPLGFGLWRLFRNMGDMAVAGLETGGPLFHIPLLGEMGLENLLVPGPIYIPLLVAGINFATTRVSLSQAPPEREASPPADPANQTNHAHSSAPKNAPSQTARQRNGCKTSCSTASPSSPSS